ncbi:hypothetical protein PM082_004621 [Marasmius tenuissimus]|nr:hypothetical protein PM082_004621 [Marasmius tenuissimus]
MRAHTTPILLPVSVATTVESNLLGLDEGSKRHKRRASIRLLVRERAVSTLLRSRGKTTTTEDSERDLHEKLFSMDVMKKKKQVVNQFRNVSEEYLGITKEIDDYASIRPAAWVSSTTLKHLCSFKNVVVKGPPQSQAAN